MGSLDRIPWIATARAACRYLKSCYLQSPERAARLIVPLIGAVPFAVLFDAAGAVKAFEEPLVRLVAHRTEPQSSRVVIVRIGDEDFRVMFKSRRPLDPYQLRRLLDAIAALKPDAIGVDLDTSDGVYQPLAKVSWGIPVIWARQATFSQRARKFYTAEALGGAGSPNSAGLVELIADSDGAVRRYRRFLQTDCGHLPLLPVALLKAGGMADRRDEDELLVDFYGHTSGRHRDHWWAGDIIKAGTDPDIVREQPLKNKIVLLGVGYRGIDELRTPLGWMNGVEILAHIAETDHLNVAPTTRRVLSLIILAGAFLIALGFATLGTRRAVSAAVAGTGASALLMWFYTSSIRDTLLLVAVLVAVLAQQIYSKVKEFLKREGERVAEKNAQGHRLSCV